MSEVVPVCSNSKTQTMSHHDACASCGKKCDNLKQCTACRLVSYCNVQCQRDHRKIHRKACQERTNELDTEIVHGMKEVRVCDREENTAKVGPMHTCWICIDEEGPDGEPLLRDCSCRGDSGFAHAACVAQYALRKSEAAFAGFDGTIAEGMVDPTVILDDYRKLWTRCPNCNQFYDGRMGFEIGEAFVRNTSVYDKGDFRRILARLTLAHVCLRSGQIDAGRQIFRDLLNIVQSETNRLFRGSHNAVTYPLIEYEISITLSEIEASLERFSSAHSVLASFLARSTYDESMMRA